MTANPNHEAVKALADEIARNGQAGDDALALLAKGAHEAIGHLGSALALLASLRKGKKGDDEEPDEGGGDDEGGDDEGGDDDDTSEGGGAAGYEDLRNADPSGQGTIPAGTTTTPAPVQPVQHVDPATNFDATEFIFQQAAVIERLDKAVADQGKLLAEIREQNAELRRQNEILGELVVSGQQQAQDLLLPLSKAVGDTRLGLLGTAAPSITPTHFPNALGNVGGGNAPVGRGRQPVQTPAGPEKKPEPTDYIGGSKQTETMAMFKALSDGVIDVHAKEMWRHHRKFSEDEAQHAAILAKVEKIANPLAAS